MSIRSSLKTVIEQQDTLTLEEARQLSNRIFAGKVDQSELALLIGGMASRGETAEELAGFALSMRALSNTLPLTEQEKDDSIDTCGTGGDGVGTFNISTGAALVAAAAGAKVAKHGNRAVTSLCGSADVLAQLGIPVALSSEEAIDSLRVHGFCFLLASVYHPSLSEVAPLRRAVGVRTVFNALGPLLNPAGVRRQVVGVYSPRLVPLFAKTMPLLGVRQALIVHGDGGLDELSLSGPSIVADVRSSDAGTTVHEYTLLPENVGLQRAPNSAIEGGTTAYENAAILSDIFGFRRKRLMTGPYRDVVLLNAAAVLVTAGLARGLQEGVLIATQTIESRAVERLLCSLQGDQVHRIG